jgi:hypothetical protein
MIRVIKLRLIRWAGYVDTHVGRIILDRLREGRNLIETAQLKWKEYNVRMDLQAF